MLGLSVSARRSGEKRTLRNAEAAGAFVINLTPRYMADVMIAAAEDTPGDVDDFARLSVTPALSSHVPVERIQECPAALECRVARIVDLAPSRCRLIVAQIVAVSIRDEFYDPETGFDALGADLLASVGVDQYVTVNGETLTLPVTWE
jgi:flavin reductase (DIM6/NTAB) family NADH-FMN oxidoreductase RutF